MAAVIDHADSALGDFKRRQASAFRSLVDQEESLEEELAAVAGGILAADQGPSAASGKVKDKGDVAPMVLAGRNGPAKRAG